MAGRKGVIEMLGEFLREGAVLVLVFAFLDRIVKPEGLTLLWALGTILVSGVSLALGMVFECARSPRN